jgi:hypothetical protein
VKWRAAASRVIAVIVMLSMVVLKIFSIELALSFP